MSKQTLKVRKALKRGVRSRKTASTCSTPAKRPTALWRSDESDPYAIHTDVYAFGGRWFVKHTVYGTPKFSEMLPGGAIAGLSARWEKIDDIPGLTDVEPPVTPPPTPSVGAVAASSPRVATQSFWKRLKIFWLRKL